MKEVPMYKAECPHLMKNGRRLACSFNDTPYMPSLLHLEDYCSTARHLMCGYFVGRPSDGWSFRFVVHHEKAL